MNSQVQLGKLRRPFNRVAQIGIKLPGILLPGPPKCWSYRWTCLAPYLSSSTGYIAGAPSDCGIRAFLAGTGDREALSERLGLLAPWL